MTTIRHPRPSRAPLVDLIGANPTGIAAGPPKVRRRGQVRFIINVEKFGFLLPWRKLIIAMALVFMGALGSIMTHAHIANTHNDIRAARRDLQNYQTAIFTLNSQLSERYTFEEVERIATERLGMIHPDASQIITITVARQSTVVLNSQVHVIPEVENFFWQDITNFFRDLVSRIFGGDE